jgi:hypothetical protein
MHRISPVIFVLARMELKLLQEPHQVVYCDPIFQGDTLKFGFLTDKNEVQCNDFSIHTLPNFEDTLHRFYETTKVSDGCQNSQAHISFESYYPEIRTTIPPMIFQSDNVILYS